MLKSFLIVLHFLIDQIITDLDLRVFLPPFLPLAAGLIVRNGARQTVLQAHAWMRVPAMLVTCRALCKKLLHMARIIAVHVNTPSSELIRDYKANQFLFNTLMEYGQTPIRIDAPNTLTGVLCACADSQDNAELCLLNRKIITRHDSIACNAA